MSFISSERRHWRFLCGDIGSHCILLYQIIPLFFPPWFSSFVVITETILFSWRKFRAVILTLGRLHCDHSLNVYIISFSSILGTRKSYKIKFSVTVKIVPSKLRKKKFLKIHQSSSLVYNVDSL